MSSLTVMIASFGLFCVLFATTPLVGALAPTYCRHRTLPTTASCLSSTNKDVDFSSFNPFEYSKRSSSGIGMSGTQISLRKTNLQALVGTMLSVYGDAQQTLDTLHQYKDFLLEPLENMEAPLDPESVYNGIDNREGRYQAYRKSMEERIATAKDLKAKQVLKTMMDYVLQYE